MRPLARIICNVLSIVLVFTGCKSKVDNLELAKYEIEQRDFLGAIIRLNMQLQNHPQSDTAYFLRSSCYTKIWKDSLAELDVAKAIQINPNYHEAYLVLGSLRLSADDTTTAVLNFKKAIESPDKRIVSNTFIEIGRMRYFAEKYQSALNCFKDAIEADSNNSMAWYYHGLSKSRFFTAKGETGKIIYPYLDFDRAKFDFSKTISLSPELADAWFQRSIVYFNIFNDSAGMVDINQAILLAPAYSYYYLGRAHQHLSLGRLNDALNDANAAIERGGKDPNAFEERAIIFNRLGNYKAAQQDSLQAVRLRKTQ
jgi:tetratricopeptide (TPR) repeat protein